MLAAARQAQTMPTPAIATRSASPGRDAYDWQDEWVGEQASDQTPEAALVRLQALSDQFTNREGGVDDSRAP